jgi:aspartyl-tRNA(Asn)/glutamyl-tRNA(Gln) amidotransferase subunit C
MDERELRITAELAMLELTDAELERFRESVSQLLEYAQKMMEIDVDQLDPTTHTLASHNRLREDVLHSAEEKEPAIRKQCPDVADALVEQSPETSGRFILIPKVL